MATDFCAHCREEIGLDDRVRSIPSLSCDKSEPAVVLFHEECFLRRIFGGLNHQMRRCTCCGGTEPPDPEGMTRREAARAAVELWMVGKQ